MIEKIEIGKLELKLRQCEKHDIGFVYELMCSAIGDLFARYTQEGWSRKKFKTKFSPEKIIIIEHENMPIGFLYFKKNENEIYWGGFYLSKDYREREIGTNVTEYFLNKFREEGIRAIYGKIFKANKQSLSLVEKLGFFIEGEIPEESSYIVKRYLNE